MFSRPSSRRSRSRVRYGAVEALETRALLAGDLAATISRGDLILEGDRAANKIEVTVEDGDVVVRGLDGTTINGQPDFVAFADSTEIPDDLVLRTGEGSDEIVIGGGLTIRDRIDANLGAGANAISILDVTARDVSIRAAGANEVLLQDGADISNDVVIRFSGNGADTIVVDGASIGDDLSIRAGNGHNSIYVDGASVGDDVGVAGGRDRDDLTIQDSDLNDDLSIRTRNGDDFVQLTSADIADRTGLSLGLGDDNVQATESTSFGGGVRAVGSLGGDTVEFDDSTEGRIQSAQFEGTTVDADVVDERLDGTDGLNTRRDAVEDRLTELVQEGTLSITIDPSTFGEGDGSVATGTITTDAVLVRDVEVTLTVDDDTEVSVPATVTILAGETSATFDVTAVDDSEVDETQTATITASANRFVGDSVDVTIEDDDMLSLEVDETSVSEAGDPLTATLTRSSSTADDLVVTLSSDDSTELSVPETVTIEAGESSVTFLVTPVNDDEADGNQSTVITASESGHTSASVDISVTDDDFLTLTIDVTEFSEGAGDMAAIGTIERANGSTEDLVVTLVSSDESAVTVPATVTIPAGSASVTFDLSAVDDLVDNDTDQVATITASADGQLDSAVDVTVTDDDTLELTISSTEFFEGTTDTITATVTRGGDTTEDLIVQITSSNTNALAVPEAVTIPAGSTEATFELSAMDDDVPGPDQIATISASQTGFTTASVDVTVNDDEIITVSILSSVTEISESGGLAAAEGRVRRESATDEPLVVTLTNSDPTEISIPQTVTIPAGSVRVFFDIDAVDDSLNDGLQTVIIQADAPNHTTSSTTLDVADDTGLAIEFPDGVNSAGEELGVDALVATVIREGDITEEIVVTLVSSDTTELTVPDSITIPAGSASAEFSITTVDDSDVDLTQVVEITASATDFDDATAEVEVLDDDAAITVTAADSEISETEVTTTITLMRNSDPTDELVVDVAASSAELSGVPATATFLAGEDTVTFDVTSIDDTTVQGDRDVDITVSTPLHQDGIATITIIDDEAQLTLTLADALVAEGFGTAGTSGTVRRNTPTDEDLVVSLVSSNEGEIGVPASVTIPAGQEEVTFDIDVLDDDAADGLQVVVITATAPAHAEDTGQVEVNDDELNTIRVMESDRSIDSGSFQLTRDEDFLIEGLTAPNATVMIDTDGDNVFDDDVVTADAAGVFTYTAALEPGGDNVVNFSTTNDEEVESTEELSIHRAVGTVVRFSSNVGFYDVELLDDVAPITVANFLNYQDRFVDSVIHRAPANFVIQGGGFTVDDGGSIQSVNTDPPIQNEFNPDNSNIRGTLSMALLGGQPNSGTSGWFVNTVDNSFLDDAQHTVFGRVIADGLEVVDAIQALDIFNLTSLPGGGAFAEAPLLEPFNEFTDAPGTVSGTQGEAVLTGTGTSFTTDVRVGDLIRLNGTVFGIVGSVLSDTELTLTSTLSSSLTDVSFETQDTSPPVADDYVVFSSISEILDNI